MPFKIQIQPVARGAVSSTGRPLADGNNVPQGPVELVVNASDAQIKALQDYCGHVNAGTDTSAVETAINAL